MKLEEVKQFVEKVMEQECTVISPMKGGMMNESFLFETNNGKKYIVYFPTKQANEMVNREVEHEHVKAIYDLGITSKNVYFNEESGIKINEYIIGTSLTGVDDIDYKKIARLLKTLHNSIFLSRFDYKPFERFVDIYEKEALTFQDNNNPNYVMLRDFLFSHKKFLEGQPLTLCHNDAQRSNIIKTPDDEYFLIDFEFVGNNDPIYDVATFGNDLVTEGRVLLNEYFDGEPSLDKIKRYYLWRIFISLQWYNVAITKHHRGEGETHHFDFMQVANHFLNNAKDAYDGYQEEINEDYNPEQIERMIKASLDKIRHFLQKDGGDVEFVSFDDGIVYVHMQGACQDCAYAGNDIKELVEVILQEEVPGILEVRSV